MANVVHRTPKERLRVVIRGAVQGVGFRPFVYRLATELGLCGWVNNSPRGVFVEVEGEADAPRTFLLRIEKEKPPRAMIQSLESAWLDPVGFSEFVIRPSEESGARTALILPDIATCEACLRELFDPSDRRYRHPFITCTHCGPRYTLIESLPYDRPNTTMKGFAMCPRCRAEYENPLDRRFHAQPIACPDCGPRLAAWDREGNVLAKDDAALLRAADSLRRGEIVALKGIGGFQLLVDARRADGVAQLRRRKHREEKPFALMFPRIEAVREVCEVSALEQRLLLSPESPIVLLRRRREAGGGVNAPVLDPGVAPGNPNIGVMLPYSPLHHLLMQELGFPVVATSGNRSDEPICIDEHEALERLGDIADVFVVHDRPIARHADDSIARVLLDREQVLRRARGYAPLPVSISLAAAVAEAAPGPAAEDAPVFAVGAQLKNSVAVLIGTDAFVSQHIGDLDTQAAREAFFRAGEDLRRLYQARPECVVCDLHPDYASTRCAEASGLPMLPVQHHAAHVLSCMAENALTPPVLGVAWDGTGYGTDGTIWGGEFFRVTEGGIDRVGHFRPFPLPGGDAAVREPRRSALGALYACLGQKAFDLTQLPSIQSFAASERSGIRRMLEQDVNCPRTTSVGRLFDAVASLIGLRQVTRFEGQAAMELEFAAEGVKTDESYSCRISASEGTNLVDWEPLLENILEDRERGVSSSQIAAKWHNTLVEVIVQIAERVGDARVCLSGGCFQNRRLTEAAVEQLRMRGIQPYWHQRVPPNDGGIALGQLLHAARHRRSG